MSNGYQQQLKSGVPAWLIVLLVVMAIPVLVCGGCLLIVGRSIDAGVKAAAIAAEEHDKAESERRAALTPEERLHEDRYNELPSTHASVEYLLKPKFPTLKMDHAGRTSVIVQDFGIASGSFVTTNALGDATHDYEIQVKFEKDSTKSRQISVRVDDNLQVLDQQAFDELSEI